MNTQLPLPQWRLLNTLYNLHARLSSHVVLDKSGADVADANTLITAGYAAEVNDRGEPRTGPLNDRSARLSYLQVTERGTTWVHASPHNAVLFELTSRRTAPLLRVIADSGVDGAYVFPRLAELGLVDGADSRGGPVHMDAEFIRHYSAGARVWLTVKGRHLTGV